jgi:hypothetical protein
LSQFSVSQQSQPPLKATAARRAELVGERTFGKGVVQYYFPTTDERPRRGGEPTPADGSGLKVTVAKYITPGAATRLEVEPPLVPGFSHGDSVQHAQRGRPAGTLWRSWCVARPAWLMLRGSGSPCTQACERAWRAVASIPSVTELLAKSSRTLPGGAGRQC